MNPRVVLSSTVCVHACLCVRACVSVGGCGVSLGVPGDRNGRRYTNTFFKGLFIRA